MAYLFGNTLLLNRFRKLSILVLNGGSKMNKEVEKIRTKIYPVLKRYDISRAAVFGSFARGENTQKSDIDILVEFLGKKSLLDLAGLKMDLEEILGRDVDVLTYNSLHPLLKERILKEQEVIYG